MNRRSRKKLVPLGVTVTLLSVALLSALQMIDNRHIISGLVMLLSGAGLVVFLTLKIARLENTGEDKEKTLKTLADRLAAIELAGEGIAIADENGRISFANRAFAEIHGYASGQAIQGLLWLDLCALQTRAMLETDVLPALAAGGCWNGVGEGCKQNGETFRQSLSLSALPGRRWILVTRDVSETLKTETLSRHRLAAIEAAGDGIGITDPDGNLIYMNRALKSLHEMDQYEAQNHIGQPWRNLYTAAGQQQIDETVLPALQEAGYWKGESQIMTAAGNIISAEMSLTRLPDGGMIGTARDISDRIEAEKTHAELERKFYQAQKMDAIGRLAGGIAHDFNNVLAAMMGYAEFLIEDLPAGTKNRQYAQAIFDGGAQAKDVVDRLLTFSRTQDHTFDPVDLRTRVEETISILRASIPATMKIELALGTGEIYVEGNKTLIAQAIMNLCVNARDAIGQNHGTITIRLARETTAMQDGAVSYGQLAPGTPYAALSVSDDGCGMDSEILEHIFDPFFTTKPVDKGTGLGLASVHGVMTAHKGAIAVRSIVGQGSCFTLFFPVMTAVQPGGAPKEKTAPRPLAHAHAILVVDDKANIRHLLADRLTRMGHAVETAGSGRQACAILKENPGAFNLVITDQTMPGMTGCELAGKIAHDFPAVSVILMSGHATDGLANQATNGQPDFLAILRKPIHRDELSAALARVPVPERMQAGT